jgi:hypothetical protein
MLTSFFVFDIVKKRFYILIMPGSENSTAAWFYNKIFTSREKRVLILSKFYMMRSGQQINIISRISTTWYGQRFFN